MHPSVRMYKQLQPGDLLEIDLMVCPTTTITISTTYTTTATTAAFQKWSGFFMLNQKIAYIVEEHLQ